MFWATSHQEWADRIVTLIRHPDLYQGMGVHGIRTVVEGYSLSVTSEKFLKVLQSLQEGDPLDGSRYEEG